MLPPAVQAWVATRFLHKRSPAYLVSDREGKLVEWGGCLEVYGIQNLTRGEPVGAQVYFLEGLLPLGSAEMFLPYVQTDSGISADIHLFSNDHDCVLLLDATQAEHQQSLMQQKVNDLNILRDRMFRRLEGQLGTEHLSSELPDLQDRGERRELTVLYADIRGFTAYSETVPPEQVFETLGRCHRAIVQPILDEAGMVIHIIGDTVAALFGILPTTGLPPVLAFRAATRIQEAHLKIRSWYDNGIPLEIGIGLASGPVCVGILEHKDRRRFGAIGFPVHQAARLHQRAGPGEIIVDAHTHHVLTRSWSTAGNFHLAPQNEESDLFYRYRMDV